MGVVQRASEASLAGILPANRLVATHRAPRSCRRQIGFAASASNAPLETPKAIRKHPALFFLRLLALPRRGQAQTRTLAHIRWRDTKLAPEGSTETGWIRKTKARGDLADRQHTRTVT